MHSFETTWQSAKKAECSHKAAVVVVRYASRPYLSMSRRMNIFIFWVGGFLKYKPLRYSAMLFTYMPKGGFRCAIFIP